MAPERPIPLEVPAELLEIVRRFVDVRGGRGIAREHRDGHGLLVHIEAEEDCLGSDARPHDRSG